MIRTTILQPFIYTKQQTNIKIDFVMYFVVIEVVNIKLR